MTKRLRRRVHFAPQQEDLGLWGKPLFTELTIKVCRELWYQPEELAAFKQDTRNILLAWHTADDGGDDRTGLDRYTRDRSEAKRLAIEYILIAQREKGATADYISLVSQNCTARAQENAFLQGFKDHCQVYGHELPSQVSFFNISIAEKDNEYGDVFEERGLGLEKQRSSIRKRKFVDNNYDPADAIFERMERVGQRRRRAIMY